MLALVFARSMKYHEFAPDPAAVAARIAAPEAGTMPDRGSGGPGAPAPAAFDASALPSTLEGLTALRDRDFVQAAYRVVLGRDPDPAGLDSYLSQLRAGASDKIDILGDLRYSPEGRARAVELPGLQRRYRLRKAGRVRVFGRLFRWLLTLVRLPMLVQVAQRHQAEMEQAQIVAESHSASIAGLRALQNESRRMAGRLETAESALSELFAEVRHLGPRLTDAEHKQSAAERELQDLRNESRVLSATLAATEAAFEARHQRLSAANARITHQLRALSIAAAGPAAVTEEPAAAAGRGGAADAFDAFYLDFEDRFRGSREETKRLQELYLDYVEAAGAGTPDAPVVDVGCGRGEWLELLQEHGCAARGVDLNVAMVAENRARGLDVVERDVVSYLAGLPDASVGMVTGFHIIEHLPFDVLVRLFDQCRRVLKPGGCMLFETPNPENLVVSAYTFYFDPTHRHPLPPPLVEFIVQQRGFDDVEILRLHPRPEAGSDSVLLDKWFRAPTDYAVIGWKGGRAPSPL